MTDGLFFFKKNKTGFYLCIRDDFRSPHFNGNKIFFKIINKDVYLYLYTTKRDV